MQIFCMFFIETYLFRYNCKIMLSLTPTIFFAYTSATLLMLII